MKLCLTCRWVSGREARFCGRCGRTFGCRRCPKGHANHPDATWCQECGDPKLSVATSYVPLGLARAALLLVAALFVWALFRFALLPSGVFARILDLISAGLAGVAALVIVGITLGIMVPPLQPALILVARNALRLPKRLLLLGVAILKARKSLR